MQSFFYICLACFFVLFYFPKILHRILGASLLCCFVLPSQGPHPLFCFFLYRFHIKVSRESKVSHGIVASEEVVDSANAAVVGYGCSDRGGKQESSEGRCVLHGNKQFERYIQLFEVMIEKYRMSVLIEGTYLIGVHQGHRCSLLYAWISYIRIQLVCLHAVALRHSHQYPVEAGVGTLCGLASGK